MNHLIVSTLILLSVALSSCIGDCELLPFTEDELAFMAYTGGETLEFRNDQDDVLIFEVTEPMDEMKRGLPIFPEFCFREIRVQLTSPDTDFSFYIDLLKSHNGNFRFTLWDEERWLISYDPRNIQLEEKEIQGQIYTELMSGSSFKKPELYYNAEFGIVHFAVYDESGKKISWYLQR